MSAIVIIPIIFAWLIFAVIHEYQILVQMSLPQGSRFQVGWIALYLYSHHTPYALM